MKIKNLRRCTRILAQPIGPQSLAAAPGKLDHIALVAVGIHAATVVEVRPDELSRSRWPPKSPRAAAVHGGSHQQCQVLRVMG